MFSGQIIFNRPYQEPKIFDNPFSKSFEKLKVRGDNGKSSNGESPVVRADKDIKEATIQSNVKFDSLVKEAENVLLKVTTLFPFKLFPTHVVITPTKIDIVDQLFFFSEHIHSIMIKDVSDVMVDTSLFFADLRIIDRGYIENFISVPWLSRSDALKARDIIQGLVTSDKAGVDIATLDQPFLTEKAEALGRVQRVHVSPI